MKQNLTLNLVADTGDGTIAGLMRIIPLNKSVWFSTLSNAMAPPWMQEKDYQKYEKTMQRMKT